MTHRLAHARYLWRPDASHAAQPLHDGDLSGCYACSAHLRVVVRRASRIASYES